MKRAQHPAQLAVGIVALAAACLSACAGRQPVSGQRDLVALAACRERADEVYEKQNRADVYRADVFATSGRDAPYATSNLPGVTTRGLSGEYERDNLVDDCLNASGPARPGPGPGSGSGAGRPAAGGSPTAAPPTALPSE